MSTEISAAAVKALRDLTDLPMMACKSALMKSNGDQKKAIEILREEAGKVSLKRADNPTSEGRIVILSKSDGSETAMVEVQCESAPVAGSPDFVHFAEQCAKQLLNGQGASSPAELLTQPAPDHSGKTLAAILEDMTNRIREKMVLTRIMRAAGLVGGYVHHDGKQGALFQADGKAPTTDILKDVAMHVTGMRPLVVNPEELDQAAVNAERERLSAEAKASGKPDNIISKIVDGRMKMYYKEQGVLTFQDFAKDDSKSVSQVLAEQGLKAVKFTRWAIGA
ncbi:MAG: translation elongation factor Ts [Planctomycetaceae bacterium]